MLKQLSRDSGGPKMAELLYTLESLEKIFSRDDVKIITLEACVDHLCEGSGHQGDAERQRHGTAEAGPGAGHKRDTGRHVPAGDRRRWQAGPCRRPA